ncbi:hypothetical protein [Burkholderia glumae]|uniref:hypothetical protein n=1 Tax=Burkholderia glumae TaxID=337 RepID=UPI00214FDC0C|nr:hypothetical protein [Burkholderia glumae]
MKRPSFQFYPGDWMNDAALRMVSVGARGLWIDMMCIMHQGSEYGYLKVNGKVILASNLARMTGSTLEETEGFLGELEAAGVFSRDDEDCIFSRRMIRDEKVRQARAAGGSKGGNPALTGKLKDNLQPNLGPTPSSSSSSSTSSPSERKTQRAPRFDAQAHLVSRGVDPQVAEDWLKLRKGKRLVSTPTALDGVESQAGKADMTLDSVIRICCARGWAGFDASWLTRDSPRGAPAKQSRHNGFDQIDYREGVAPDGTF